MGGWKTTECRRWCLSCVLVPLLAFVIIYSMYLNRVDLPKELDPVPSPPLGLKYSLRFFSSSSFYSNFYFDYFYFIFKVENFYVFFKENPTPKWRQKRSDRFRAGWLCVTWKDMFGINIPFIYLRKSKKERGCFYIHLSCVSRLSENIHFYFRVPVGKNWAPFFCGRRVE